MNEKWDERFIELAQLIASWSKDPSTKMGCVIVGPDKEIRSTGFNGFPRGFADREDRLQDRNTKYSFICHAEENAIMHAARVGVSLKGCAAYTSSWPPCTRCARSLIQAGITEIIHPACVVPERWIEDFRLAAELLGETGIDVRVVTGS